MFAWLRRRSDRCGATVGAESGWSYSFARDAGRVPCRLEPGHADMHDNGKAQWVTPIQNWKSVVYPLVRIGGSIIKNHTVYR